MASAQVSARDRTVSLDLHALARALGGEVRNGQALVPGPGHSAADRSLSVKIDPNAPDGFLVHSFSGDDPRQCRDHVRAAWGLPSWKPNAGNGTRSSNDIEKAIAAALVAQTRSTTKPAKRIVKTYDYNVADGTLSYQNVRLEPKDFLQRRPSPDEPGVWIWGLSAGGYMRKGPGRDWRKFDEQKFTEGKYTERRTFDGVQRVIYRWPELLAYPDATIFVTEGEKDSDNLAELGHCATTVASGKWTKDCIEALAGRHCIILQDNDEAGRKKAIEAAKALHAVAASTRIVLLPGLPEGGDVSDWFDEAGPGDAARFADICMGTPVWQPEAEASDAVAEQPENSKTWNYHSINALPDPQWLVKYILPETGTGIMSGQWGTYKTTVALDLSLSVMADLPFAGRYQIKRRGAVLFFAVEGAGTLPRRLAAVAAHRDITEPLPFAWRSDCPPLTAKNAAETICALVKQAAAEIEQKFHLPIALIWIDTIIAAARYDAAGDDNDAASAQRIMTVLAEVARRTGAFVVGVDHFGKVVETGTRGSSAKEGGADTVLALLADRELSGGVKNTRLALRKQRDGASGFEIAFTVREVETGTDSDGDPVTAMVIDWQEALPAAAEEPEAKWTKSLKLLRRVLMSMLADAGQDIRPWADGPLVHACDIGKVRDEFYRQYPVDGTEQQKTDARRQGFNRALKAAQGNDLIACREIEGVTMVWFASREEGGIVT
jgi:hypothetical protein